MADVHTVLVESALARVEVLDAVRDDARGVDAAALVDGAASADEVAARILTEAVRASLQHVTAQVRDSVASVKEEVREIRKADPATVPAVTNKEIAARKAEKVRAADG